MHRGFSQTKITLLIYNSICYTYGERTLLCKYFPFVVKLQYNTSACAQTSRKNIESALWHRITIKHSKFTLMLFYLIDFYGPLLLENIINNAI